ncbi:DUF1653 domain-containing protein [Patescibacteria group bacterium]|nr:DUF1653 domain-containing protein [Patescibacteria group bacterium]
MSHEQSSILPGEIYRHYKRGTAYKIVCLAVLEATEEPCVVYEALDLEAEHRVWVRPLNHFCELVNFEGKQVPRFAKNTSSLG